MPSINKVTLIGHVGYIKDLKYSQAGNAILKLSIATRRNENETDWHNITVFKKAAENASKYIGKGDLVYVSGRITYDKNEGKTYTNIIAFEVWNLSSKKDRDSGQDGGSQHMTEAERKQKVDESREASKQKTLPSIRKSFLLCSNRELPKTKPDDDDIPF